MEEEELWGAGEAGKEAVIWFRLSVRSRCGIKVKASRRYNNFTDVYCSSVVAKLKSRAKRPALGLFGLDGGDYLIPSFIFLVTFFSDFVRGS